MNLGAKVDEQGLEGFALELSWEIGSEAIEGTTCLTDGRVGGGRGEREHAQGRGPLAAWEEYC